MEHLPAVAIAIGGALLAALLILHGHPMGGGILFLITALAALGVEL